MMSLNLENYRGLGSKNPIPRLFGGWKSVIAEDNLQFILQWLQSPLQTGALVPSGRYLADAMAGQVDLARPGSIVELGGGTGTVTHALLRAGASPDRLIIIEREKRFHERLVARFPGVRIVHGDAVHLRRILAEAGVDEVNAIVSGLPLLSMPFSVKEAILEQSFELVADGGVFIQFSYGLGSPVPERFLGTDGMTARPVAYVWRNLPPAKVWKFTNGKTNGMTTGRNVLDARLLLDPNGSLVPIERRSWFICFVPPIEPQWWHPFFHRDHKHVFALCPERNGGWTLFEPWWTRLLAATITSDQARKFLRWGARGDVLLVRESIPGDSSQLRGMMTCGALVSHLLGRRYFVWTPHQLYRALRKEPNVRQVDVAALLRHGLGDPAATGPRPIRSAQRVSAA